MLSTTVPRSRFLGKPLTEEDTQTSEFICEVGNIAAALDESLDVALTEVAFDFEIDANDYVRTTSARQQFLRAVCSFLLQRPVADSELIREHLLNFDSVDSFFYTLNSNNSNFSSEGEKSVPQKLNAELETLRRENRRLKLENERIQREKELAEEQAISAMRRRSTNRFGRSYTNLDELMGDMLTQAVADGIRQAVNSSASTNFLRSLGALQSEEVSNV